MDREDLDRRGVGLQAPAALLVAGVARRPRRSAGAATTTARPSRAARWSPRRAGAGRRGAGRSAGARRRRGEHPARQPLGQRDPLGSDATPRSRSTRPHSCSRRWTSSHVVVAGQRDPLGRPAEKARQRRRPRARRRRRPLDRVEQPQPLAGAAGVREHAARTADDGRDPGASSASRTCAALRCVRTSTATWPGATGSRPQPRRRLRAHLDLRAGRPAARRGRRRGRRRCARARAACGVAAARAPIAGASRRATRMRSGAATGAPVSRGRGWHGGPHLAVDDALVAEPRAANSAS